MKILLLSDNYWPEMNANARIFSELAVYWKQGGNEISVITSQPNFPKGKLFDGYTNKWLESKVEHGIRVIRVKTYMHPNKGFFRRTIDFMSFGLSSFIFGIFQRKYDAIVGVSPQFFCALSACLLAKIKCKPFVLILCDLWPDAILHSGKLKNKFLFKCLKKLELYMYKKANLIATLSPYYDKYLMKCSINKEKIMTSLSGVDKQFFPRPKNKEIEEKYNLTNKFVIAYIGTFGLFHNHDHLLDIALDFQLANDKDLHFLLIGDGVNKHKLIDECASKQLKNVTIDGPFTSESIPEYWSVADVALVILANIKSNTTVIPSKMLEAMAMGKPLILYAPEGEATRFLDQAQAGFFVENGDKKKLAQTFLDALKQVDLIQDLGKNALAFAQNYTRENQADQLLKKIQTIVASKSEQ